METTNYLRIIQAHKLLIKANMHKLPKYFEHMYNNIDDELNDELTMYKKEGIINGKYYSLLESVAKFINKYDLDVSIIKKSILNLINSYCRIKSLNKACFSEPEEISDDETGYESESNDETSDDKHQINNNTNKKPIIIDKDHENDLRIILKQAIKSNDRELMISTMELLKKFDKSKSNTVATAFTTNTKTPNWLIPLKCTVNTENNKQSFKYAITASKTSGDTKFRLTRIEKHFKKSTYPPNINDYKLFENNNPSIKLIIF